MIAALHAAATLFMTGLIWFVQIVHYPLFARVGADEFARYHGAHEVLTTWVVGPAMLVEAGTAVLLAVGGWNRLPRAALAGGALLLAVIWLSTAFLQVPQHAVLSSGFDADAHRFLVTSNWIRTAGWTLRSVLALWIFRAASVPRA